MGKEQELFDAARNGQADIVESILNLRLKKVNFSASLRKTPGPNCQDASGYTPLHFAALNGHKDVVRTLLQHDANVNIVDKKGCSPLHLASWAGHYDIVNFILMQSNIQPNINLVNNDNETSLHCAAQFNHSTVVELLLMNGADIRLRNNKNETPFDLACEYGRYETVQILLDYQPDLVFTSNHLNHTPLHLAAKNGHQKVIKLLLNANFDVNCVTENGSALHEAVFYGRVDIVRILLDYGIDTSLVNAQGKNVFDLLGQLNTSVSRTIESIIENYALNNQRIKNSNSPLNKSTSLHYIQPPEKFTDKQTSSNGNHLFNNSHLHHHPMHHSELVAYAAEASNHPISHQSTNLDTYVQPPKQFAQQSTNYYLDQITNSNKFNSSQRPNRKKISSGELKLNKNSNFSKSQDSILDEYLMQNQYEQPNYQQLPKKKQQPQLSTFVQHHHNQQSNYKKLNKMISSFEYTKSDDIYSSLEEPIYSYPSSNSYLNDNQPNSLQNNYLENHLTEQQIQPYSSFNPSFNYHKSNLHSSAHNLNQLKQLNQLNKKQPQQQPVIYSNQKQSTSSGKSLNNRNSQSHHHLNYLNNSQKIYASNINYSNNLDYSDNDAAYNLSSINTTYQSIDKDQNLINNDSSYDPYSVNYEPVLRNTGMMKRSTSNTSDSYNDNVTYSTSTKELISLPISGINYAAGNGIKNSLKRYSSVVDELKINKNNLRSNDHHNSNLPMETVQRIKVQNSNDLYAQVDKTRKNSLKTSQNKIANLLEFYDQPSKLIKKIEDSNSNNNSVINNNNCKVTNSKMINHLTNEQLELYTEIEKKVKPIINKNQQQQQQTNDTNVPTTELRTPSTFLKSSKLNREKRQTIAITLNENEFDELNNSSKLPPDSKLAASQINKILQPIHDNYKKMKLKPNKQTLTDPKQFNKFQSGKKMIIVERDLNSTKNLVDKSVGTDDLKNNDDKLNKDNDDDKTIKKQDQNDQKSKLNNFSSLEEELLKLESKFNEIKSTKDNKETSSTSTSNTNTINKPRRPAPPPPPPKHKTSTTNTDTLNSTNSSSSTNNNLESTATINELNEKIPNKIDKNLSDKERELLKTSFNLPLNLDWKHDPVVLYKQTCHYLAFYLGTSKIDNLNNTQLSQQCIKDYRKLLINNNLPTLTAVILSISYKNVRCVDVNCQKIINEYEIKKIHYCAQSLESFRFFSYVTKEEDRNCFNCHVFSACNLELANEILTTLSQAFEIGFRIKNGETIDQLRKQYVKLKLNSNRNRTNLNSPNPPARSYSLERNSNLSKSLSESQFNQLLISVSNGFRSNKKINKDKSKNDKSDKKDIDHHPIKLTRQLSASNSIKSIKSVKSESNYLNNRRKSLQSNQLNSLNQLIKPPRPTSRPQLKHQISLPNDKLNIAELSSNKLQTRANKPTIPAKPSSIKR